jgi:hypothetical protein
MAETPRDASGISQKVGTTPGLWSALRRPSAFFGVDSRKRGFVAEIIF